MTLELVETPQLCGYMMSPVGSTTCSREMISKTHLSLNQVLMSLYSLHSHVPPIVHGDPRVPNLIVTENGLTWIDLMRAKICEWSTTSASLFAIDMNILVESLFPFHNTRKDEGLNEAISLYCKDPSPILINNIEVYLKQFPNM